MSEPPTAADAPGTVIGIDLGGTKVLTAVVAPDGRILSREKMSSRGTSGYEELLTRIADSARSAADAAGVALDTVAAVGIGVPGTVDQDAGVVRIAPNLYWRDVPVGSTLSDLLGLPVIVDNDVNVAALAEHRLGVGKELPSLLGVFIGTGIGGGLAVDGGLYRGAHQSAAEIGHMVVKAGGPRCPCGRRGCLEALGSRTAITRQIARLSSSGQVEQAGQAVRRRRAERQRRRAPQSVHRRGQAHAPGRGQVRALRRHRRWLARQRPGPRDCRAGWWRGGEPGRALREAGGEDRTALHR